MWKFKFYSIWNLESVERYLGNLAIEGWIIKKIRFFYWFSFSQEKPCKASFFFPYTAPKDSGMLNYEILIEKTPNANRVDGGNWLYTCLYQIPKAPLFLTEAAEYRKQYIRKVLRERFRADVLCLIFLLACFFAELCLHQNCRYPLIFVCVGSFFALRAVYNGFGLFSLSRNHNMK